MEQPEGFPDRVEIFVEIPRGSRNKYEFDEKTGFIRLDRVLSSAVYYNFDYGFIDETRAADGDHTDAVLLIGEGTFPGCRVRARVVGGLEMSDENGFDFKVLCVAEADPQFSHYHRLEDVSPHRLREIENFFQTYKLLENKQVDMVGWHDLDKAREILRADREAWIDEQHATK